MKPRWLTLMLMLLLAVGAATSPRAQDKFRDRHYRVRIAVNDGVDGLVLQCRGAYQVESSTGAPLTQLTNGQIGFIQITRGKPGARTYRLVLREMDAYQVEAAIALARKAKDSYRLPVKVLRIPGKRPGESRIIVTLGEYARLEEARNQIAKLPGERISYIYEDRSRAEQGQVRLVSREGMILARDPRFLKLSPLDVVNGDLAVQELESGRWSPSGMARARRYRGEMELTINEDGLLTAVNDLWIEYYLYSVVAAEIGSDAPDESLKAQAVAGRSEAVAKIELGIVSSSFFDFYNTSMAQTYRGKQDETERVRRAVDATRGEILIWRDGSGKSQFVDAVYGHSCGGYVSTMNDMWDGKYAGYSQRRLDQLTPGSAPQLDSDAAARDWIRNPRPQACCNPNQPGFPNYAKKYFRWKYSFTGEKFSRMADRAYGVGTVKDVTVTKRMPSGRVRAVRIKGSSKSVTVDRELEIRSALGDLESTFFAISTDHDAAGNLTAVVIDGAGFGHGVGMCQMGAYMLGRRGCSYRQILGQYFTDVRIRRLYR